MKNSIKKRILSLVLCVSMILPMVVPPMPVYSVEAGDADPRTAIGAVAEFKNTGNVILGIEPISAGVMSVSVDLLPTHVVIKNYYYDEVNDEYWYQIDSAPGNKAWPTDYADYHWAYAHDLTVIAKNGMTGVFDANGNSVSSVTLPLYEKIELSAESSLQGSVKYQWQIEYEEGKWVDIYGEDEPEITLSIGMIATLLVDDSVNVRCVSTSASKTAASGAIAVTVDFSGIDDGEDEEEPEEPNVPTLEIQMNGESADSVTTTYGNFDFGTALTASTTLSGTLAYKWEVMTDAINDRWSTLSTEATCTFGYEDMHFKYYDTSSDISTIRLTVSNEADSLTDTFVVYRVAEVYVTNSTGDTTGTVNVTVSGSLPEDASLNLGDASDTTIGGVEASEIALAVDVTITQHGSEWQPADGETVRVSIPASQLGLSDGQYFTVYHIHNGKTELIGPFVVENGYVTFEIDGFSVVVISTNYGAAIGGVAEFADSHIVLDSGAVNFEGTSVWTEELPAKVVIKNYVFDDYLGKLFYEIDAAPGYTWPAEYAELHWCYSHELANIDVNGEAGVYDANGNPVADATVSTTDSVTVKVVTSLQSADIDYKWQICYDTANDLWVDIAGETAAEITLTAGMVASLMDENNQVLVRCVTTAGSKSVTSAPVTVTLFAEDSGETEEPKVEIQIDGASADSVDVNDADKYGFNSVLSANTNLSGTLTYSWEVLYDTTNDIWEVLGTDATFAPCFDAYGDGVWLRSYYIHYVDAATSAVTVRLTVSNGVTTLTDTFTINVKYEVVEEATPAVYSRMTRNASSSSSDPGAATAAETTTTYNVIINYLDENGEKVVADPYTSVVSPTTILTNTISFPKIVGYAPMVYDTDNAKWVRQDSYTFDGTPFTGDFILNVYYYPDAVDYKVNIYVQNAENDEYTLYTSYVRQELTGTVLDKITFNIPGYYQSKFSSNHAAIAADGSTEFNLYYDRIYYLMKFDLDGGYGVQPIYARHGVKLDIPNPTKAGYTFVGWDQTEGTPSVSNELLNDGIANTIYEYMPIGNTAYKAIWKAVDNAKVTIVYWGENPNDEKYSYLESQELYVKPGTELTFGTNQLICTLTPHQHGGDDCTYKCGITPHTHSLDNNCYTLNCNTTSHNHAQSGCTLNCAHQEHELSCYSTTILRILKQTTKPSDLTANSGNGIYTYRNGNTTYYYLYLNGTWYCAYGSISGNKADDQRITLSCNHGHTDVCYSCGLNESTHVHSVAQGCYTLTCQTEAHTHSDTCYSCVAHTHSDDCYLKTNKQDATKYYYVRSDTVTVAADGSTVMNVYYDRTSFTYNFYEEDTGNYWGSITDKWGANIYSRWTAICTTAGNVYNWTVNSNGNGPWTSYIGVMGTSNMNYYSHNASGTSTAYYYFQRMDGTYPTDTSDSKNPLAVPAEGTDLSVTKEDIVLFEGFTFVKGETFRKDFTSLDDAGGSYDGAKFYYSRNRYNLEFNNGEGVVKTESVLYQASLSGYTFTPTAPSYYEAGSVEFAGWYQNPECTGEEVKLDGKTMPASNMILYAKWVPVKHNVTVYRYRDADGNLHDLLCNHTDEAIGDMEALGSISHGELLNKHYIPEEPTNGNYTFVTWAYYDEESQEEVTIDINSFVVTKDVEIYAKWSSNVQVPYTIKYMIEGTTTEIAAPSEGKHYAGETHTFNAKTAGQLNAGYQTGYFPLITSHSIDFKAEDSSYEYIFYYAKKDAVPYTVYYVTETPKEGDTLQTVTINENGVQKTYYMVAETKQVNDNVNAIVTENFAKVTGYMPDAYQKTLIIDGSDNAVNQIIFEYSVNTTQAYYKVTHWTEQTDGSWFTHASYENVGTIGDTINESPMTITGFTYSNTTYKVGDNKPTATNSPLTADGLEINLYYLRNKYPYTVQYVLQGTDTVLYTETVQDQYYGDTVYHEAPEYWEDGVYKRISAEKLSTVIQTDASKNLITFYYIEQEVTIKYEVADGFGGTVNPSQETVLIKSENAAGSVAAPLSSAYKFIGWYDQSGNLVGEELEFIPEKVNGLNVAATYCAKFEYNLTSLTIVKDGAEEYKDIDPNQSFVFDIYDGDTLVTTVTVNSTTGWKVVVDGLTVGKYYTVTEKTDWSWRYHCTGWEYTGSNATVTGAGNEASITLGLDGTITFTNTRGNEQWLDGDSWCNNIFN